MIETIRKRAQRGSIAVAPGFGEKRALRCDSVLMSKS